MRQEWIAAFGAGSAGCLTETNRAMIRCYDKYDGNAADKRSYISTAEEEIDFTLHNPNQENLVFAALDNCILGPDDPERCDFTVGNLRRLYLVEVKRVSVNGRRMARTSAIDQLSASLAMLRARMQLGQTEIFAVICLKAKQAYPVRSATRAADRLRFLQHHQADLVEGQVADFSSQ